MAMTHTTIATYIHKALDVELDFRAKITLNFEIFTDNLADGTCLVIGPVLNLDVFINAGLVQNLSRATTTYTKDVGQGDLSSLVLRKVYTNNSYCHII